MTGIDCRNIKSTHMYTDDSQHAMIGMEWRDYATRPEVWPCMAVILAVIQSPTKSILVVARPWFIHLWPLIVKLFMIFSDPSAQKKPWCHALSQSCSDDLFDKECSEWHKNQHISSVLIWKFESLIQHLIDYIDEVVIQTSARYNPTAKNPNAITTNCNPINLGKQHGTSSLLHAYASLPSEVLVTKSS